MRRQTKIVIGACVALCVIILAGFYFFPGDNFENGQPVANVETGGKPGSPPLLVNPDPPQRGQAAHPPQ